MSDPNVILLSFHLCKWCTSHIALKMNWLNSCSLSCGFMKWNVKCTLSKINIFVWMILNFDFWIVSLFCLVMVWLNACPPPPASPATHPPAIVQKQSPPHPSIWFNRDFTFSQIRQAKNSPIRKSWVTYTVKFLSQQRRFSAWWVKVYFESKLFYDF